LSRCEAQESGELFRMNMPFELGIDYGCRRYSKKEKKFLILDEKSYRFKEIVSDISDSDIISYEGDE